MGKQYLNGVLYGTGKIIKFSPYIYSLEEREVGVWTDGKPLYQKTLIYDVQTSIGEGTTDLVYLDNPANVTVIDYNACAINKINGRAYKLAYADTSSSSTNIIYNINDNGYFAARVYRDSWGTNYRFLITVRYIKTTDTPGSGHYTTNGGETHHYSTSEQIVGTWIDGKPLYEKTLIPTQLTSDLATEDFMISNIERIVRCSGRISNNANILCANVPFYINNDYRVGFETRVQDTSTVRCKSYFGVQSPRSYKITDITIQYTKTTD